MIDTLFLTLSILAIITGGTISAFTARKPTWSTAWVSAYLVLIVGVIQFALVDAWRQLGQPDGNTILIALLAFNLGNGGVIAGTLLKRQLKFYRWLVNAGGALIALAMALLLFATQRVVTTAAHIELIALTALILISMPIGLYLSNKRHSK